MLLLSIRDYAIFVQGAVPILGSVQLKQEGTLIMIGVNHQDSKSSDSLLECSVFSESCQRIVHI